MYRFLFCISGILFLNFILGVLSEQACSTLPLSVSNLDICEDSSCRTTETAQLRLELNKGSSLCVRIESTSAEVAPAVFNITVVDSVLSYPLVDCYFSDDPQIDISGFCGCPGGTTVSCDSCPATEPSGMDVLCTSGLHNSKGCLLGGAGTWCTKLGFNGDNRFKVCDIGSPELVLSIQYFDTATNRVHTVTNPTTFTLGTSTFNLTMTDFSVQDKEKSEFMVWDTRQNQNFYLIPDRYVNFHDTYDPEKLGWFKTNKSTAVTNDFFKSSNIQVSKCSDNSFHMGTSAKYFGDFLTSFPEFCSQRVSPGVILRDPGFGQISAMSGEIIEYPVELAQGKYFSSINGETFAIGIDTNGNPTPSVYWQASGWTIDTINAPATVGNFLCSNGTHVWTDTSNTFALVICVQLNSVAPLELSRNWGVCDVSTVLSTGDTTYTCTDVTFVAYSWPDGTVNTWGFNTSGFVQLTNNPAKLKEVSDAIIVPIKRAAATVLLEFKNVTFVFNTINAIPHIDSIDDTSDDVVVVASSKTVPGNCVLMISNDLGPTISVYLALLNNKYRIPITAKKFHGKAVITLQCYKNTDSVSLDINIDKGDPDIVEKSINSTSVREASINDPSLWNKFTRNTGKAFNWLGGIMSTVFNLTGNKIGSFFLGALIVIAVIAAIPLILVILYKLAKWMWYMIRSRKLNNNGRSGGIVKFKSS